MNIYDFSANCLRELTGEDASTSTVQRVVGTLRSAGFDDTVPEKEFALGKQIVSATTGDGIRSRVRTASVDDATTVVPVNSRDTFSEMIALKNQGLCPRCKTGMERVKLSSYDPAYYCPGCRTTLWVD